MHRCLSLYFVVCGALVGCNKAPAPSEGSSLASASATASARALTAPRPEDPRDFGAMFKNEQDSRPTGTIKVEAAYAAFQRDGVPIDTMRQHLARPYGARYCVGAHAGPTVVVSVCEYVDAEAARAGAEMSRKIVLENREIRVNQATTLTVREQEKNPAADETSKKLFDSFAKL